MPGAGVLTAAGSAFLGDADDRGVSSMGGA